MCGDLPFCYLEAGDDARRIQGIRNMRYLYSNFFERYCVAKVSSTGNDISDGEIGNICYMLWDIFMLHPGNASPGMVAAALDVMANALQSKNDNCVISAIHGLGHWALTAPRAKTILSSWLRQPTTKNETVREYARQGMSGGIL